MWREYGKYMADFQNMFFLTMYQVNHVTDTFLYPHDCCVQFYGLVQDKRNSSPLAMELSLSCTNPSN